jgi:hypothetical protein
LARIALYLAVTVSASIAAGVAATTASDAWSRVDPAAAAYLGLVYFGPASLVLAVPRVARAGMCVLGALLGLAITASWVAFATIDSSTSALIFLWGWFAGVPAAAAAAAVARKLTASPR